MPDRSVLTLGNFDGPHIGHLAILAEARQIADAQDAAVVAVTFDPPPIQILHPGSEPPRIASLAERVARLKQHGADEVQVIVPTPAMLGRSPAEFIQQMADRYHPVAVVEGPDFRFGKGRAGDMAALADLGQAHGFEAVTVPRVNASLGDLHAAPVSSSLVRWLVGRGRVADAASCLGRPFSLTATVVEGERRGRKLGVPTANLDDEQVAPYIVPADGVYAGTAALDGNPNPEFAAAISIGVKPTFGKSALTVEAHLLPPESSEGEALDLYGKPITLRFARWVRDQYPFPGVDALRDQLHRDIEQVRRWHADGTLNTFSFSTAGKA